MTSSITRVDLYKAVQREVGLTRQESLAIVELVLDEIGELLGKGETVKLSSFGSFIVRNKRQRPGRNPMTGAELPISARRVVVFKASAILKQRINGQRSGVKTSVADPVQHTMRAVYHDVDHSSQPQEL
jgi:integration host factor subunit alpha